MEMSVVILMTGIMPSITVNKYVFAAIGIHIQLEVYSPLSSSGISI